MQIIILILIISLVLVFIFYMGVLQFCLKLFKVQNRNLKNTFHITIILMLWSAFLTTPLIYYGKGPLVIFATFATFLGTFFILRYFIKKYNKVSNNKIIGVFITYYVLSTIIMSLFLILIRATLFVPFYYVGQSMEPSFKNGDYVLIKKINNKLNRGDIVVYKDSNDKRIYYFKRIIGLPGEKITIKDEKLLVNGKNLSEEAYLPPNEITQGITDVLLKNNEYFMLGDNRDKSYDSRITGPVKKENIIGKMWIRPGITINLPQI